MSADASIDPDITIGSVLLRENPTLPLPAPPAPRDVDISAQPTFTPYEVKPELKNGAELQKLLERSYPLLLKQAGIGGVTTLWVFIDPAGVVRNTRVVQSSGYAELDRVAQEVVERSARFSRAFNRDERVAVWIQIPVTFQAIVQP